MEYLSFFMALSTLFSVGAFLGWVIELFYRRFVSNRKTKKWVNPGFLTGPYLPLYGFGLIGLYLIRYYLYGALEPSTGELWATVITLLVMAVSMTVIEYIAGLIFIKGMGIKLWDYSKMKGNIQGIICPLYSLFWAIVGVIYFFGIHPWIDGVLAWIGSRLEFLFVVGFFYGVFAVDLWHSLDISVKIRRFAKENKMVVAWEQLKISVNNAAKEAKERTHFLRFFKGIGNMRESLVRYQRELEERSREFKLNQQKKKEQKHQKEQNNQDEEGS